MNVYPLGHIHLPAFWAGFVAGIKYPFQVMAGWRKDPTAERRFAEWQKAQRS